MKKLWQADHTGIHWERKGECIAVRILGFEHWI